MFVSDATATAAPALPTDRLLDRQEASTVPGRTGHLLGLVRKLVEHGKALLSTLTQRPASDTLSRLPACFGTINIALVIARITRGLRIAGLLEVRLKRSATRLDNIVSRSCAPPAADPRPVKARRVGVRRRRLPEDDAALLARLPSEQELAERLRNRAIGDIIAEICSDFGIVTTHPLWAELRLAVVRNRGYLPRLFKDVVARLNQSYRLRVTPPAVTVPARNPVPPNNDPPNLAVAATGPP